MIRLAYLLLLVLAAALLGIVIIGSVTGPTVLTAGSEIPIPNDYDFAGASAYGQFDNVVTFYCRNKENGRIFTCNGGRVGEEIILPDGYSFSGVSAHGTYDNVVTFYCRQESTGRVFVCNPK